jgi:hypothetical protein
VSAAIVITVERAGELSGSNALESSPSQQGTIKSDQPLAPASSFRISPASLKAWFAAGTPQ